MTESLFYVCHLSNPNLKNNTFTKVAIMKVFIPNGDKMVKMFKSFKGFQYKLFYKALLWISYKSSGFWSLIIFVTFEAVKMGQGIFSVKPDLARKLGQFIFRLWRDLNNEILQSMLFKYIWWSDRVGLHSKNCMKFYC